MANNLAVTGNVTIGGTLVVTGTTNLGAAADTVLVTNFNADKVDGADLDTDGTLAANSDVRVPSQKAVKTYADLKVPTSRQIIAGVGLSGGGDLSADRTLTVAIPTLYIEDQKSATTDGGTSYASTWTQRNLNTVVLNSISGASLASNRITLPAGTYFVDASAPAFMADQHVLKLYNYTDSTDILIGSSAFSYHSYNVENRSHIKGVFTLSAQKEIELRHNVYAGLTTSGFGHATNLGVISVYSQIEIRKIS